MVKILLNLHEIRTLQQNLENILCGFELAVDANITKPYKRTLYFRNPSLPLVASPIPHPCALLLHLHVSPLR